MLFVRKLGYPLGITIHKQDNNVSEEVNEKAEERLSFFLLTPYTKMAHGFFRLAALLRDAQQKAQ